MRRPASFASLCVFLLFLLNCTLQPDTVQTPPPTAQQAIERPEGETRKTPAPRDAMRAGVTSNTKWSQDGKFLYFSLQDQRYQFDLTKGERSAIQPDAEPKDTVGAPPDLTIDKTGGERGNPAPGQKPRPRAPSRGRQHLTEDSPNGRWRAVCRDWNVQLEDLKSSRTLNVTTTGNRKFRYGTANWVYGEELYVYNGMWWSGDSKKLAYYVFDERPVRDFYMLDGLTKAHTSVLTEGFMTAGEANPIVTLALYDRATSTSTPVDCGQGDQYLYNMRQTPDGKELLISRTDRRHKQLDILALDFATGKTRVVVTEKQDSWQENAPAMRFLRDGKRFIWETEKTLWKQYELRHLDGSLICTLTRGEYPALDIVRVDEEGGWLYYTAYSAKNPLSPQLHRVRLDGTGQKRLTDSERSYRQFRFSPDGKWFIAQEEDVATPPSTVLYSTEGKEIARLAEGPKDLPQLAELYTFKSQDGKTDLYGVLYKPEDFDPAKKYPVLVHVYGGPEFEAFENVYRPGHPDTRRGCLVTQIGNRGSKNRGKAFMAAVYQRLGDVDAQDQADGVRYLAQRPYVDATRVGIVGHSYGGYMSAMTILKHPDVFAASVDRAGPNDWRNYDTVYTERYMNLPQDNPEGYRRAMCSEFAGNLKGKFLIMHGLMDDNVHPNNAWQLIEALDKAGKYYESRFIPNSDHSFGAAEIHWEFLERNLGLRPLGK